MKYDEDTRVTIISLDTCARFYSKELLGKSGKVRDFYQSGCRDLRGVSIDGFYNEKSKTGVYWFPVENLTEEGDMTMAQKNYYGEKAKFAILTDPLNPESPGCVGAYFGKLYANQMIVAQSATRKCKSARPYEVFFVECAEVDPGTIAIVDYEIVGLVDTELASKMLTYKERVACRQELKERMAEQAKKYQEEEYWRVISESDPVMKVLYEEFKALED